VREGKGLTLSQRVARRLRGGALHTLDIARDVLRLSGHPGAASAAVFQLLGSDPRFRVDAQGIWSLDEASGSDQSLAELSYVVVDVETTGGSFARGDRITEIAAVEVRGGVVVDEFQTLLNPGRSIPPMITRITGIDDRMVAGAPYFDHVADEVMRRVDGRVFVAHNAAFDWGFVSGELLQARGDVPGVPRLCTVRMARALVPELRRRNLDAVTRHFGVEVSDRHRAYGDALATAKVLMCLLDEAGAKGLADLPALERYLGRNARKKEKPLSPEPPEEA